eukprot:1195251-Prorocentrum_minimum.AAC.1
MKATGISPSTRALYPAKAIYSPWRRDIQAATLGQVALLRLCGPASLALPPFADLPEVGPKYQIEVYSMSEKWIPIIIRYRQGLKVAWADRFVLGRNL